MQTRVLTVTLYAIVVSTCAISAGRGQVAPEPDSATVVFYSGGSLARQWLPRTSAGTFFGGIFDGKQVMARLGYRSIFIVRMQPGGHTFSSSTSDWHPAKNSQIYLDLAAGHTYYLRAMMEHDNLSLVGSERGRLETVSCETARDETKNHLLVPLNHISDDYKKNVMDEAPPCEPPAAH